uniref:Uncharacterized protein n=1 Tax=Amphimedon queenslandica TaxID=400682 RepID=A0A1X7SFB8_AMPQE
GPATLKAILRVTAAGKLVRSSMAVPVPKKKRNPAVLQHDEISQESLPDDENIKLKCKYCKKEITGSTNAKTNWWKHL